MFSTQMTQILQINTDFIYLIINDIFLLLSVKISLICVICVLLRQPPQICSTRYGVEERVCFSYPALHFVCTGLFTLYAYRREVSSFYTVTIV